MRSKLAICTVLICLLSARSFAEAGMLGRPAEASLAKVGKTKRLSAKSVKSRGGAAFALTNNSKSPKATLTALYGVSFLVVVGNALVAFSPAPALMKELGTATATRLMSMLASTAAFLQIMLAPAIGSYMDSLGRKPIFCASLISLIIANTLVSLRPTVLLLSMAKVVGSFGVGIFFLSTQAILSDLTATEPDQLSSAMGIQLTLTSLGFLVGALIAGQLAEKGLKVPYRTSACVLSLAASIVAFVMGETMSTTNTTMVSSEKKPFFRSPFASFSLFRHNELRVLVLLLLLSTMPTFMGEVFQVYAKAEWNLEAKAYASFVALFGVIGIFGNIVGSILVRKIGVKLLIVMATLSSMCVPIGAITFEFKGVIVGALVGFLSSAQGLAIGAAFMSEGRKLGIPQGQLAGDRSSFLALLKVIAPLLYSALYVQGKKVTGLNHWPFMFNITLAMTAFMLSSLYL